MPDLHDLARLLIDRRRLAVMGRLALRPASPDEIAEATDITITDVRRILGRLVASGFVITEAGQHRLDATALRGLAVAARPAPEPPADHLFANLRPADAQRAARFFRGTRLVELPGAGPKRTAVLLVLLDEFEPGRYYKEADVRRILRRFHPDDAALRRFMVEAGMLLREPQGRTYWRGGGPGPDGREVPRPLRD